MTFNIKADLNDKNDSQLFHQITIVMAYLFLVLILLDYTFNLTHGLVIALGIFYLLCLRMSRNPRVYFHIKIIVLIAVIWVICRLAVLFLVGI